MPVNFSGKVSQKDIERANKKKNPPEYEEGFEPTDGDAFETLFLDEDSGGSASGSGIGGLDGTGFNFPDVGVSSGSGAGSGIYPNMGMNTMNQMNPMAGNNAFGNPMAGNNLFGNSMNPLNAPLGAQQQPRKRSKFEQATDEALDKGVDAGKILGKSFFSVLKSLPSSFKIRTAEEWGYYAWRVGAVGLAFLGLGVFFGIVRPSRTSFKLIIVGAANIGTAMSLLGFSAFSLMKGDSIRSIDLSQIQPSEHDFGMSQQEYEQAVTELDFECEESGSLSDIEPFEFNAEEIETSTNESKTSFKQMDRTETVGEYKDALKNAEDEVRENVPYLTRGMLVDTFAPLLETYNPDFYVEREIPEDSEMFIQSEILLQKALGAVQGKKFDEIESRLVSASETTFVMIFRMERVSGLNKLDAIEREVLAYFRESSSDHSVTAQVLLEGDNYKIEVQKGESVLVSYGDCLRNPDVEQFIRNPKNKFPFIAGVKSDGKLVLIDGRDVESYMIAGKARSGKSWSVFSYLMSFMLWNTPSDIQFVIVDPKESVLFTELSAMPHVCGLHKTETVLEVLRGLIEVEGARRKKILKDNHCETIWDLREKGVTLPILIIVIDEIMTVIKSLTAEERKEFNDLLVIVMTQLPSLGIRPMIVPHRAQGVLDKTLRTNIDFRSAIRATEEVVKETLGINKWTIPLQVPGSAALFANSMSAPAFVYGVVMTDSNIKNTELLKSVARIYYKMGIEIPEMADLPRVFNRDLNKVREMLGFDVSKRVQMTANTTTDFEKDNVADLLTYSRDDFENEFNREDFSQERESIKKEQETKESTDNYEEDEFENEEEEESGFMW